MHPDSLFHPPLINAYAADDIIPPNGLIERFLLRLKPSKKRITKLMKRSFRRDGDRYDFIRTYVARHYGIKIGKYSYGFKSFCNPRHMMHEMGAFCSIAENVHIAFANHSIDTVTSHSFIYNRHYGFTDHDTPLTQIDPRNTPVTMGHDVWIGRDATILCGVHIGTGAVVAAGAVVTKDVPPYAIVGGVPAKIIKYRFDEETIQRLLDSAWWTWPDDQIRTRLKDFMNPADLLGR